MAIISFKGKALIPAPLVSFDRIIQRTPEGTSRQHGFKIKLVGQLFLWKGSPLADGSWHTTSGYPSDTIPEDVTEEAILDIFKKKIGALVNLFDSDGLLLIQPQNGGAPIKAQLTINNVVIPEGKWTRTVPYTIEAEAQSVIWGLLDGDEDGSQTQLSNPPEESWQLEQSDEVGRIFKLTHSLSSFAKKRFDDSGNVTAEGWEVAKDLIIGGSLAGTGAVSKLGFDSTFLTSENVLNLDNFQPYNYIRSETVDKGNGRVTISETWTCIDPTATSPTGQTTGKAIEELSVETRHSLDDGLYTVSINGNVTGLEERNSTNRDFIKSRWDNANERMAVITPTVIFNLAEDLSDITLNPTPISTTISKNRITGAIQYSYIYNNRVGVSDSSYLSEIIEIEFSNAADVFAEIPVINRPAGPILQSIGSTTRKSATVSYAIRVATSYGSTPTIPTVDPQAVLLTYISTPTQLFLASDSPRWNPKQGLYTRNTTFVYQ